MSEKMTAEQFVEMVADYDTIPSAVFTERYPLFAETHEAKKAAGFDPTAAGLMTLFAIANGIRADQPA